MRQSFSEQWDSPSVRLSDLTVRKQHRSRRLKLIGNGDSQLQLSGLGEGNTVGEADVLARRVRIHLRWVARQTPPITYQALAKSLGLSPPNTIHQLTVALERLMEEDAKAIRPLIAALVVSKARGGLPAPGFFECARRVGRFDGDPSGPDAAVFYAAEFEAAVDFWRASSQVEEQDG